MESKRKESTWDNLPTLAISIIFRKSSIEDRFFNLPLPLVCKSLHPRCWASMITESHPFSADDAFIKAPFPYHSVFCDPFRGRPTPHPDPSCGVLRLQMLLGRAEGAILELIRKCRKLELVDLSDPPYIKPRILQELRAWCPEKKWGSAASLISLLTSLLDSPI